MLTGAVLSNRHCSFKVNLQTCVFCFCDCQDIRLFQVCGNLKGRQNAQRSEGLFRAHSLTGLSLSRITWRRSTNYPRMSISLKGRAVPVWWLKSWKKCSDSLGWPWRGSPPRKLWRWCESLAVECLTLVNLCWLQDTPSGNTLTWPTGTIPGASKRTHASCCYCACIMWQALF